MLIYISHPYGNKKENKEEIDQIIKYLVKEFPEDTYISPVHTFGFMYDDVDYQQGLDMCLELLSVCDEMFVYGDYKNSKGCKAEIEYANDNGIDMLLLGD